MTMVGVSGLLRPAKHPGRRMSDDEMEGRALCDIQDPNATLPNWCSICGAQSSQSNPLRLAPVDRAPKSLARAYLYKSICLRCSEQGRQ